MPTPQAVVYPDKHVIINMYDPQHNPNIKKTTPESVIRHRVHSAGYIAYRKYMRETKTKKGQAEINELAGSFGCECRDAWSHKFTGFGEP